MNSKQSNNYKLKIFSKSFRFELISFDATENEIFEENFFRIKVVFHKIAKCNSEGLVYQKGNCSGYFFLLDKRRSTFKYTN